MVTETSDLHLAIARAMSESWTLLNRVMWPAVMIDDNHKIVMFNSAARQLFGYEESDDILGQPLNNLLPDDRREIHTRHIERFAAGADMARPMNNRERIVGLRKDGSTFLTLATISKSDDNDIMLAILMPAAEDQEENNG